MNKSKSNPTAKKKKMGQYMCSITDGLFKQRIYSFIQ